jgi:putative transposase
MPWRSESPMKQRMFFVDDCERGVASVAELCRRYGVSRKTGYKWLGRFGKEGVDGLKERGRRPHGNPRRVPGEVERLILEIRRLFPDRGAKKILKVMRRDHGMRRLPAQGTVCGILKRNGCIEEKRRRVRRAHPGRPTTVAEKPNSLWTADFKGEFKMQNGVYCHPLTIADSYSRYLLRCQGLLRPTFQATKKVFAAAFEEYGLPERIRTDNGTPFASNALGRLSRLSVWWIRLGIYPELTEPASPQQNGQHERMHKTLKAATTRPPKRGMRQQQERFDVFRENFNEERPHEALRQETPASKYRASLRRLSWRLAPLEYPGHYEVRLVSTNGGFRWNHVRIPVGHVLGGEYIGLEAVDDGLWDVYFGPIWLGRLQEDVMRIVDERGRYFRRKV